MADDLNAPHSDARRIVCSGVTDTLIRATEFADSMENVIVLSWQKVGGCRMFSDEEITVSEANMLLDVFKHYLLVHGMSDGRMCDERDGGGDGGGDGD